MLQQVTRILLESQSLMYFPTFIVRKRFVSLFFLIQYTAADDSGSQAVYQEDSLTSSSVKLDNSPLAFSGPPQFTTPYTSSSSASIKLATNPSEPPQNDNGPEPLLFSNENCHSAAEQAYPSRRRRKRQNGKTVCDIPDSGAPNQLENNNGQTKPNSPTQNSVPNPNNGHNEIPIKVPPPVPEPDERFRFYIWSMPGWDGESDPIVCNNPDYPLVQVPVCAPPTPPSVGRTSPAAFVVPCKFSKSFPSPLFFFLRYPTEMIM